MELKDGALYIVAGQGVLMRSTPAQRVARNGTLAEGAHSRLFITHGNYSYWAAEKMVVSEASRADVLAYREQEIPRNSECRDPECWCVEVRA